MVQFGKKKSFTDYFYTKPVIFLLLVILILLSISVYERYKVERDMSERRKEVEEEQRALVERKEEIKEQVEYLEGERGIEEEVRKRFDVAKEGEQVVILLGEDGAPDEKNDETEVVTKKWYQFWR